MTEKNVDFTLSPLLPPLILGMGSIGQNSTFFQNSINTNQQRHLYGDNLRGSRIFLSGGGGGGGGGGSRPLNFIYSLQRGPMDLVHIFQGRFNFFQCVCGGGGGSKC